MNHLQEILEFIRRAEELSKPFYEEFYNHEKNINKKYFQSEKGKMALKNGWLARSNRFKESIR